MIIQTILSECKSSGVNVFLTACGMSATGDRKALEKLRPILKEHKAEILEYLTAAANDRDPGEIDLVREFMEVDGLTLEEAQALTKASVQPRPPHEWLALIHELDAMIGRYCEACKPNTAAHGRILDDRRRQSPASIPASLAWFKRELAKVERPVVPFERPVFEGYSKQPRLAMLTYCEGRTNGK